MRIAIGVDRMIKLQTWLGTSIKLYRDIKGIEKSIGNINAVEI